MILEVDIFRRRVSKNSSRDYIAPMHSLRVAPRFRSEKRKVQLAAVLYQDQWLKTLEEEIAMEEWK